MTEETMDEANFYEGGDKIKNYQFKRRQCQTNLQTFENSSADYIQAFI